MEDIKVVNITDINLDKIYGTGADRVEPFSDEGYKRFTDFINEKNWAYYADENEFFNIAAAKQKAEDLGKDTVLVENYS